MSTLSIRSQLCKEVDNEFQKYKKCLTKPQHGNAKEMALGMVETESIYLTKIGKKTAKEVTPRQNTERFSNSLQGMNAKKMAQNHLQSVCRNAFPLEKEKQAPVLIIPDGGDLQKPYAKKMKNVCKTVDGSNGHKTGKGYPTLGIVAYGTKSKETIPLTHHVFTTNIDSPWEVQKKELHKIVPYFSNHNLIYVEDRIADDEKRIKEYKNELNAGFIIRLTVKRKFDWKDENGKILNLNGKEIAQKLQPDEVKTKTYVNKKIKKKFTSKIAFTKVKHKDLVDKNGKPFEDLTMIAVYTKEFDDPMLLLTDQKIESIEDAWTHFFYYKKRWEVEKFFREVKQMFSLEKFLIRDFNAIQALVTLVLIVYWLAKKILAKLKEGLGALSLMFDYFCKREQRSGNLVSDLLAFCREILEAYPPLKSYHFCRWQFFLSHFFTDKNQLSLFDFRKKS